MPIHTTTQDGQVTVTVTQVTQYRFPYASERCVAHGRPMCVSCARNPGDCANDNPEGTVSCSVYSSTGMHWDTCPNRLRDDDFYALDERPDDD